MLGFSHARSLLPLAFGCRSCAFGGARSRPQQPAKACLAGADRAPVRRSRRHGCHHAPDRQGQAERLALAGTLSRGRDRRAAARQDPAIADSAAGERSGRAGGCPHPGAAAGRGDPLDGARDGPRRQHLAGFGAADLGRARPPAAPGQNLQALHRPGLRHQAARSGSIRRRMPWCSRSTRSRRSKPWIAPNPGCR